MCGGASVTVVAKDGGALAKADKIQNYYGFADGISAKELVADGIAQAKNLGVKFIEAEVCGVEFGTDGFEVKTTDRHHCGGRARHRVAARRAMYRPLKISMFSRGEA